jgi:hypothetical protein
MDGIQWSLLQGFVWTWNTTNEDSDYITNFRKKLRGLQNIQILASAPVESMVTLTVEKWKPAKEKLSRPGWKRQPWYDIGKLLTEIQKGSCKW